MRFRTRRRRCRCSAWRWAGWHLSRESSASKRPLKNNRFQKRRWENSPGVFFILERQWSGDLHGAGESIDAFGIDGVCQLARFFEGAANDKTIGVGQELVGVFAGDTTAEKNS